MIYPQVGVNGVPYNDDDGPLHGQFVNGAWHDYPVGTTYPQAFWLGIVTGLPQRRKVRNAIMFYNDSFGVVPGEAAATAFTKLMTFIT